MMGRNVTAYASEAQPDRVFACRLQRGDTATLTANFNAVIPSGLTIATATWRAESAGTLSAAAIAGTSVTVLLTAGWACGGRVKCEATLSNGGKRSVVFEVDVRHGPYFQGEPSAPQPTSQSLTTP